MLKPATRPEISSITLQARPVGGEEWMIAWRRGGGGSVEKGLSRFGRIWAEGEDGMSSVFCWRMGWLVTKELGAY